MEKKLVSIVTPCYNSTGFISNLLDSILMQDYPRIEVLVVDDGSKDNLKMFLDTADYFRKFDLKGYSLRYFYQENQGQSAAINLGLSEYEGDYITWPDSDDYYKDENAISTFVGCIEEEMVDSVRCYPIHINEDGLILNNNIVEKIDGEKIFYDCLFETNFWFSPICYFFNSSIIERVLDNKIINNKVGQNFQLYLPIFYNTKTVTICKEMVYYLVRENSHSHKKINFKVSIQRLKDIFDLKLLLIKTYNLVITDRQLILLEKRKDISIVSILIGNNEFSEGVKYAISERLLSVHVLKLFFKQIFGNLRITLSRDNKN
ncbi:glycosyltransferase family 2 protein [Sphingobacterium hungaricum]|uniref:Glycosyl transferase family 2 n=1 Tax=Sphingobacterium hungaricum TaxID=2082723 RepID=A0A928USF9_9SPHI|nr:glycosyltransferase family 2 protein [Sphingobacterium hungaricum]MBE8712360.1 glycosyl transferase family 2 [Sphingobacterium hungaricum]